MKTLIKIRKKIAENQEQYFIKAKEQLKYYLKELQVPLIKDNNNLEKEKVKEF